MTIEDAKPIFIFDADTELQFLQQADDWTFPVQFTLAKTGLRSGELVHLLIEDVDLENGWLHVRNKPELCWNVKTRRERSVPLIKELADVLRIVIGTRSSGPLFIRHKYKPQQSPLGNQDRAALNEAFQKRIKLARAECGTSLSRARQSKLASTVWRDAGAIRTDRVRTTFMRTANLISMPMATCPKSWRHTFATLLQDANVDPLIRQITLGHKPSDDARGGLGMTSVYTHTRAETQKCEIERALRFWPCSLEYAHLWITNSNHS